MPSQEEPHPTYDTSRSLRRSERGVMAKPPGQWTVSDVYFVIMIQWENSTIEEIWNPI